MKKRILPLTLMLYSQLTWADGKVGVDVGSVQENRSATNLSSQTRNAYDGYLQVRLVKSLGGINDFALNLDVGYLSTSSHEGYTGGVSETITTSNPYLGFSYQFFRKSPIGFNLGVAYSPFVEATYSNSAASDAYKGTATIAKAGLSAAFTESVGLAVSVLYYSGSFTPKSNPQTTNVSNLTSSFFIPMVGLNYIF